MSASKISLNSLDNTRIYLASHLDSLIEKSTVNNNNNNNNNNPLLLKNDVHCVGNNFCARSSWQHNNSPVNFQNMCYDFINHSHKVSRHPRWAQLEMDRIG